MGQRGRAHEAELVEGASGRHHPRERHPTPSDVAPTVAGMVALQRLAGNRATASLATGGPTVQRNVLSKLFHKVIPKSPTVPPAQLAASAAYKKATAHLPVIDPGRKVKPVQDPVAELGFSKADCDDLVTSQRVPALLRKWAMATSNAEVARFCITQDDVERAGAKQDPQLLQWVNRNRPAAMAQFATAMREARLHLVALREAERDQAKAQAAQGAATMAPAAAAVYGFSPGAGSGAPTAGAGAGVASAYGFSPQ